MSLQKQNRNGICQKRFEKEEKFFESKKAEWLKKYKDKFAVIKEEELIDMFDTFGDAYKEGVKRYGNQLFFYYADGYLVLI